MSVIQAPHYDETERRLMSDPIVVALADEIRADADVIPTLHHEGDPTSPTFDFMRAASAEFLRRGGDRDHVGHIGAVGKAVLRLLNGEQP